MKKDLRKDAIIFLMIWKGVQAGLNVDQLNNLVDRISAKFDKTGRPDDAALLGRQIIAVFTVKNIIYRMDKAVPVQAL